MNLTRMVMLAEWLEAGAPHKDNVIGFKMDNWMFPRSSGNTCGTVCCLAGATVQFFNDEGKPFIDEWDVYNVKGRNVSQYAKELLGLEHDTAHALFMAEGLRPDDDNPYDSYADVMRRITPDHAARVVRHLLATGIVDWVECK